MTEDKQEDSRKATDKQIINDIENGLMEKEIAHKHGYGYPSSSLNRRIKELGFEKNQKLNIQSSGGAMFYQSKATMKQLASEKGIDLDSVDRVFFQTEPLGDGRLVLELTTDSFSEVEKE